MSYTPSINVVLVTFYTVAAGMAGAALAYWLSLPVFPLVGPAIVVSLASLTPVKFAVAEPVRDAALLLIGISIGAGVDAGATVAILRWPLAFVVLAVMLLVAIMACKWILSRWFGFDPRSALLAATPGHLSFVIAFSTSLNADTTRIVVVQSVRVLALTLSVPFLAYAMGLDVSVALQPAGESMRVGHIAALLGGAIVLGWPLKRLRVPAPYLIAAMVLSTLSHTLKLTPGVVPPVLALSSLVIMGTLIGARFSGVTLAQLREALLAGLVITVVSVALVVATAIPVAMLLEMPTAHVVLAFAPGGLETMIAMGAVLGANPGFLAASHMVRLFLLAAMVPLLVGRTGSAL